jgi:GH24 family phage-related lysozyme (muramidase)
MFRNLLRFYTLIEARISTKVNEYPLSAVRDWLFNIFAATIHPSTFDCNVNRINYVKTVKT